MQRKVVRTEIDVDAYEFVLGTARSKGLTLEEAFRLAIEEWAAREGDPSSDPLFDFSRVVTKQQRKYPDEGEDALYGRDAS